MSYLGDYAEDYATLNFKFNTIKFSTGAPNALAGSPVVSVYKANGTTQSTAGITLTNPFDSVVGLMHVLIDLSSDAFYATGEDYQVVLTAGTVDSISVIGSVIAEFSIERTGGATAIVNSILSLLDDPRGEPSAGGWSVNPDAMTKLDYLYTLARNKKTNNGTENVLFLDDGSTHLSVQPTSEAGGTVTVGEQATT